MEAYRRCHCPVVYLSLNARSEFILRRRCVRHQGKAETMNGPGRKAHMGSRKKELTLTVLLKNSGECLVAGHKPGGK